jgi:UDP-N-acetylglucosamine 2-epimerase (non-hydrolysing)
MSKKKVFCVVGTRPNFIKITQFEKEFKKHSDKFHFELVHTGQHFDDKMSTIFFEQLRLQRPTFNLLAEGDSREQKTINIINELEILFTAEQPDLVMVVGDVDSTYAAAMAAMKLNIKIAHLESGLRSFDLGMPEEVNRIAVDKISDYFFVTEKSGLINLKKEGVADEKVFFVGNTMIDTLIHFDSEIKSNEILKELNLRANNFILATFHRPSNVDTKESLLTILELIQEISQTTSIVIPIHPRTKNKISEFGFNHLIDNNPNIVLLGPIDYFAFQNLILNAKVVITDSGGIQEETTYRKVPCLTIRDNTERPSTIEIGTNQLLALDKELILSKIHEIQNATLKDSEIPELWDGKATERIVEILKTII